jgi:hypothetical protein
MGSEKMEFDERLYLSLKREYGKAVEEGRETLSLNGIVFLTPYAGYVIEYLSTRFEKAKK